MSINHFSTDLQETPWSSPQQQEPTQQHKVHLPNPQQLSSWPSHNLFQHHHQHQAWLNSYNSQESSSSPSMFQSHHHQVFSFNPNRLDYNGQEQQEGVEEQASSVNTREEQEGELEKEPMFEKPLTPSDVGKLNRLVIPKQHAEKYFPLGGGGSESGDKGLLLSFEDESGKCWRFRYSYWNSSQSYVLTKGWSRYVKEKRLDAGDIILFERHRTDGKRFFIRWRRRGATVAQDSHGGNGSGSGGRWSRGLYLASTNPYPGDCLHAGSVVQNPVGNSKTLRLFGVNVECQLGDESAEASTPNGSPMSSQGQGHGQQQQQFNYNYSQAYSSNRHNHMDITFSQDVNQMMRNSQG